jgi:hypothetical protein
MNEELLVAEQIVRLLHGPQGAIWELIPESGAAAAAGRPGRQPGSLPGLAALRRRPRDVSIRDARGSLVALARPTAA